MTIVENLARKHVLLKRVEENPGQQEGNQIEGFLSQIDIALDYWTKRGQAKPAVDQKFE